ncbi:hypothetical protein [Paenibacillus sp. GCM10027626]|uniref:hypothetical protein n=1 Tax=Paenibacillus sp. GCM10027626 TaxID=3273411 RepID=UPI00363808EC
MKMRLKRTMAIVLMAGIAVGLAACSDGTKPSEQTPVSGTKEGTSTEPADKKPVTLTFWSATMGYNVPGGIQDDPVAKQIEKELGIKIDMETKPSDEKLAALLATNDLKDIMVVEKKFAPQMKDLVLDLEPLIEQYGPDIKENMPPEVLEADKKLADGEQKFISGLIMEEAASPEPLWAGVYLRWDYYKELGYPAINTPDDYLQVVADMLKKHPVNEDGKKYYGFSTWLDWGYSNITHIWGPFRQGGTNLYGGSANVMQMDVKSFETTNIYTNENSGFWEDVAFWNKANRMGLLDPDSFTQKYDQATQKYNTGQVLATYTGWMIWGGNTYLQQSKDIYDQGWFGPLPMPSKGYNYFNKKYGQNNQVFAISKNAKHPERAMELINWLYSVHGSMTVANGVEGVDWVNEDGRYKYTEAHEKNKLDPEAVNKYGYYKYLNNLGLSKDALIPGTQVPIDISKGREYMKAQMEKPENAIVKEVLNHYGAELPEDILPPGQTYTHSEAFELAGFIPASEPDEIKLIADKLNNYLNQAVPKIILSEDDASFAAEKAKMIQEIKNLGEEKVFAFWDAAVAKGIADWKATATKGK